MAPDGEVLHPSLTKEAKETADKLRALAQSDRLAFGEMSKDITWFKEWTKILDEENAPSTAGIMMGS